MAQSRQQMMDESSHFQLFFSQIFSEIGTKIKSFQPYLIVFQPNNL